MGRLSDVTRACQPEQAGRGPIREVSPLPPLRLTGVAKVFRDPMTLRRFTAVEDVSLTLVRGEIFGLLGPNAAGKTTTIKMILGLIRPTRGTVLLDGRDPRNPDARRRLGYLPENPCFYDHLSAVEYLDLVGSLCGIPPAIGRSRAAALLERLGLASHARKPLRKFSKGMTQRLGLAQALLNEPTLLVLDEPMSGLDPIGRREVVDLIRELKNAGTTVVFSSHILHDVETLCDRVVILRAGRLLAEGSLESLLEKEGSGAEILARASGTLILPMEFLGVNLSPAGSLVRLSVDAAERVTPLVAWLAAHGHQIVSVTPERHTLEDLFVNLFQDAHAVGGDPERGPGWREEA